METYLFLSGTVWPSTDIRPYTPTDQCFSNSLQKCVPVQSPYADCDLNRSGECEQDAGPPTVPGV